jgi:hypothetical protein
VGNLRKSLIGLGAAALLTCAGAQTAWAGQVYPDSNAPPPGGCAIPDVTGKPGRVSFTAHVHESCGWKVRAIIRCVQGIPGTPIHVLRTVTGPAVTSGHTSKAVCEGGLTASVKQWGYAYPGHTVWMGSK